MQKSTVIYGPPGCGKTTTIIEMMKERIRGGVHPSKIGLVSFTKSAANELASRVGEKAVNASSLHSLAFRQAGIHRSQVVDRSKLQEFSKLSHITVTGADVYDDEDMEVGDYYMMVYNRMRALNIRNAMEGFVGGNKEGNLEEFKYFCRQYYNWKRANGYVDFEDMLSLALKSPPPDFDLLFLDESQDFTPSQWELIHYWVPHIKEMVLALDDDQALYQFSGANPHGGMEFEEKYKSERLVLSQSYRLPKNVHELAVSFIKRIKNRVDKEYRPTDRPGSIKRYGMWQSIKEINPAEDTLVLFRNHSLRGDIEKFFMARHLPYITIGGRAGPLQNYNARAIKAFIQLQNGDSISEAAMSILKNSLVNPNLQESLKNPWHKALRIPLVKLVYYKMLHTKYGTPVPDTAIRLSTIHSAKGGEADRVILLNGMGQKTYENMSRDPDNEVRTFYVGITRAKHTLDIVSGDNPIGGL